jgi:hypothetical protein
VGADSSGRAVQGVGPRPLACLLAVVVGSNLAGGMDVCLSKVLCVARHRPLRRADHPSRGDLPSLMRLSVIVKTR